MVGLRHRGKPAEAVVRTPLNELLEQPDAEQFTQSIGGGESARDQP